MEIIDLKQTRLPVMTKSTGLVVSNVFVYRHSSNGAFFPNEKRVRYI